MLIFRSGYFSLLGMIFLIAGCSSSQSSVSCVQPTDSLVNVSTASNSTMNVSIYLDATPSMQGFVTSTSTTRYMNVLDAVVASVRAGWKKEEIKYFRFGTVVEQLNDAGQYLTAKKTEFYNPQKNFSDSDISQPLSQPLPNDRSMEIIVTDLYQKEGEIDSIVKSIKKKYFSDGSSKSVGILAIKSEFSGNIYDIGLAKKQLSYNTNGRESSSYHPFYLIVVGDDHDVKTFFDQIKKVQPGKNADLEKEAKFVIFSPRLIQKISAPKVSNEKPSEGRLIERTEGLKKNSETIRKDKETKVWVDLLKVNSLTSKGSKQTYTMNYKMSPYALKLEKIEGNLLPRANGKLNDIFKPEIEVRNSLDELSVDFSIGILPNPGVYDVDVDLHARIAEEKWWQEWNGSETIVDQSDGSKTYNLLLFMNSLKSISTSDDKVKIAKLCYVVEVSK